MKSVKKFVYYCDHCNKRSLSKFHMNKHENGCTLNPQRKCKFCEGVDLPEITEAIKNRYEIVDEKDKEYGFTFRKVNWIGEPVTLKEIETIADGCPNCMLSIIRQSGLVGYPFGGDFTFDYKTKCADWYAGLVENYDN